MAASVQNRSGNDTNNEKSVSDQTSNDEEVQQDIPLVFQCKECHSIIGDSLAWVCVDRDLRSFTLKTVTNEVVKSQKMLTSCDDYDLGSTYYQLQCQKCGRQLGRMYTTTPRHLDQLRELYTVLAETVTSYQLGSTQGSNDVDGWMSTLPSIRFMADKLHKTQTVVLALNERVSALESSVGLSGTQTPANNDQDSHGDKSVKVNGKSSWQVMPLFERGRVESPKRDENIRISGEDETVVMPQNTKTTKRKLCNSEIKMLINKKSRSNQR